MRKIGLLFIFISIAFHVCANAEIDKLTRYSMELEAKNDLFKVIMAIEDNYYQRERTMAELIETEKLLKAKINEAIKKEPFFNEETFKYDFELADLFYKTEKTLINNRNLLSNILYKDAKVEIALKNTINSGRSLTVVLGVTVLTKQQLLEAKTERCFEYENELGGVGLSCYPEGISLIDQYGNKYELLYIIQHPKNTKLRYGKKYYFSVQSKEELLASVENFKITIYKHALGNVNPVVFNLKKEMILNEDIDITTIYSRYVQE
jgi:hypothetical protein